MAKTMTMEETPSAAAEKSEHTPGPWEAINLEGHRIFPSVYIGPRLEYSDGSGNFRARITINEGPTPENVAAGCGFGTTLETCRANARLIAAAPELLSVVRQIVELDMREGTSDRLQQRADESAGDGITEEGAWYLDAIRNGRAAIAKAGGK